MAMRTINVGKCPVCDSVQTEVRIDEGHLSARAKCVKCGEQGAKIKVSCKDDLPLACEMAARTFSTKIVDENDEGVPSVEDVAKLISGFCADICTETPCDDCVLRTDYDNSLGIGCYSRDVSDVKRALIGKFPGWG